MVVMLMMLMVVEGIVVIVVIVVEPSWSLVSVVSQIEYRTNAPGTYWGKVIRGLRYCSGVMTYLALNTPVSSIHSRTSTQCNIKYSFVKLQS